MATLPLLLLLGSGTFYHRKHHSLSSRAQRSDLGLQEKWGIAIYVSKSKYKELEVLYLVIIVISVGRDCFAAARNDK
jgi:hypothetical protein